MVRCLEIRTDSGVTVNRLIGQGNTNMKMKPPELLFCCVAEGVGDLRNWRLKFPIIGTSAGLVFSSQGASGYHLFVHWKDTFKEHFFCREWPWINYPCPCDLAEIPPPAIYPWLLFCNIIDCNGQRLKDHHSMTNSSFFSIACQVVKYKKFRRLIDDRRLIS